MTKPAPPRSGNNVRRAGTESAAASAQIAAHRSSTARRQSFFSGWGGEDGGGGLPEGRSLPAASAAPGPPLLTSASRGSPALKPAALPAEASAGLRSLSGRRAPAGGLGMNQASGSPRPDACAGALRAAAMGCRGGGVTAGV